MSPPVGTHKLEQDKVYKHFIERTRLGEWHKIFLYAATGLLWLSGLIAKARPSWGPLSMKIHGAAAMGFTLVLGSLISVHIRRGWVLRRNRFSGVFLTSICALLIVTGWILYYQANETLRNAASLVHWTVGLGLPLLIYLHILAWRREQEES